MLRTSGRRRQVRQWLSRLAVPFAILGLADGSVAEPTPPRPNILLITLDTTRADRLQSYGYTRKTSPALLRLSQQAMVYDRAYSTTTWTLPAHASLFTGRYPSSHGAKYDTDGPIHLGEAIMGPDFLANYRARGLSRELPSLPEILHDHGYATAGVVAGPWMKSLFGLARGFDHYDDSQITEANGRLAAQVTDAAIRWLDTGPSSPFFLFLNYYDPHGPYRDPVGLARKFLPENTIIHPAPKQPSDEFVAATYDAEIRYMDRNIGRLLRHLRERDLYDEFWIIVTADHGELFGEHERHGHGYSLFEKELQIPLIIKPPGNQTAQRSNAVIQLIDILPMITQQLGIETPSGIQGRAGGRGAEPAFAEVYPIAKPQEHWRALFVDRYKLLWQSGGPGQLYDLGSDPGETRDIANREAARKSSLDSQLDGFLSSLTPPPSRDEASPGQTIDAETRKALESLGYLE